MAAKPLSLQDHFLNSARRSKAPLTVFLLKGVKLQGVVTWFDTFSLLLRREGQAQLIYKHAVSTIMPGKAIDLGEMPVSDAGGKAGLQDTFLSAATRDRASVKVFLVNGVMLQGSVTAHDQFSVLLERGGQAQLVYKHAISTLQPEQPLSIGGESDDRTGK